MARIRLETVVDAPPERVFDLARCVEVHTESMSAHDEQAVDGVTEGLLGAGDRVTWRARHLLIPLEMTVEVESMGRPRRFTDVQVSGPFARWEHEHVFEPADGGTTIVDDVSFSSPAGPLGVVVDRLVLRRYLHRMLRGRLDHLKSIAESDRWEQFVPATEPIR